MNSAKNLIPCPTHAVVLSVLCFSSAVYGQASDWPTYLHDNERSGQTPATVSLPLHVKWIYKAPHPPAPAWPLPAKQDFWHKLKELPPRVIFDRAFHLVSDGQRLFFGSSVDDKVYCLDAETGNLLWSFFTEGPVRLAPTVHKNCLLFGSDDGYVYCLEAKNGSLLWKTRIGPTSKRIAGNERIISVWPIRTGVLVEDNVALCCAGFFLEEGVYQAALDLPTGKVVAKGKINISAQGYLERKGEKLFVATGRDPAGAFIGKLSRQGKAPTEKLKQIPKDYPFAFIGTEDLRFGGGDGKIAAFSAKDGKELWSAQVEGKVYSLIIAGNKLFASTDQGRIYCFGTEGSKPKYHEPKPIFFAYPNIPTQVKASQQAEWIIKTTGVDRGYALILNPEDGNLAYELSQGTKLQIVLIQADKKKAEQTRKALDQVGIYGRVVVQEMTDLEKLPFTDYLFNLIILAGSKEGKQITLEKEAQRMLKPFGGVGIWDIERKNTYTRGPLQEVGEWTHFYGDPGNTACSMDKLVHGPMALQWFGQPGPRDMIDRHHRTVAPLWKSGRLIIPGNDHVMGVDAYNGTLLWDVEIKNSRRVGAFRDCSYLVATEDLIYVAAEDKCFAINSLTGKKEHTFQVPKEPSGKPRDWGYVASVEELLIGSFTKPGASRRDQSFEAINDTYYDNRPLVCSDGLFVVNRHGKKDHWTYTAKKGLILNPTIAVGEDSIFFVESCNPDTFEKANGRATPSELLGKGTELVALDLASGKEKWRKTQDFSAIQHLLYLCYAKGKVVVVGSRNSGSNPKKDRVLFDISTFSAKTGNLLWKQTQTQPTGIGGSHGEQDHHPVIVEDKLFCEPFGYDLHTGKPLDKIAWTKAHRSGCGTISASASAFFFRQSNPSMFDLESNQFSKVTSCSRTGCWINMIPAGGLLLIPEASSGCTCNYAVQTSMAFLPVGKPK